MNDATQPAPFVLMILDGWGYREEITHNPTRRVPTPTLDHLFATCPYTLIEASGTAVGLPPGQMGNSEVGHLHLGAGRKVPQDLTRIDQAADDGSFFKNTTLLKAIQTAKKTNAAVHILGLTSPGGVHSHARHLLALIDLIAQQGVSKSYLHAILDGRDVPPKSATTTLTEISERYRQHAQSGTSPHGQIATLMGRYYAMDRDKRWDRTQLAYDALTQSDCADVYTSTDPIAGLQAAYTRGETDEFVKPTHITDPNGHPITLESGDVVIFMNFRADRARQLTQALVCSEFTGFNRSVKPTLAAFVTLTQYAKDLPVNVAYPPLKLSNTLGDYLAQHNYTQLRLAETEKYAHVTYFLNGGVETPFPKEDRILIPSPKVATYDLQPEMSAEALTDQLIDAIRQHTHQVIVVNYANPDMVGHTGIESAAEQAVAVIDHCLERVVTALKSAGGELLLTSDHGNIEQMYNPDSRQPYTAHTSNPVPLLYMGRPAHFDTTIIGALDDVAPTCLYLLGLTPPTEMTGRCLLTLD